MSVHILTGQDQLHVNGMKGRAGHEKFKKLYGDTFLKS